MPSVLDLIARWQSSGSQNVGGKRVRLCPQGKKQGGRVLWGLFLFS